MSGNFETFVKSAVSFYNLDWKLLHCIILSLFHCFSIRQHAMYIHPGRFHAGYRLIVCHMTVILCEAVCSHKNDKC